MVARAFAHFTPLANIAEQHHRTLREALSRAGISAQSTPNLPRLDPVDLTAQATAMTVLVSCWE